MHNSASWIAFRAYLQRLPETHQQRLLKLLSQKDLTRLQETQETSWNPSFGPAGRKEQLKRIHYSWFIPFLEGFSEHDQILLISSLEHEVQKKLKIAMHLSEEQIPVSEFAKGYMHALLLHWITEEQKEFLPFFLLPMDPLNALLEFDTNQLIQLIDYLGLFDLAQEMHKVIESTKLKKLYTLFSKKQRMFIQELSQEKEHLHVPPLRLEKWDGNTQKLKNLIHTRGLNRLAKALYSSDKNLLWHIQHALDTLRGNALKKYATLVPDERTKKILLDQVQKVIEKIQTEVAAS
jgi:hypothetical protein